MDSACRDALSQSQIAFVARATFAPSDFDDQLAVKVSCDRTIDRPFNPTKAVPIVKVSATYGADGLPDTTRNHTFTEADDVGDITITGGFFGSIHGGVPLVVFAPGSMGGGVSWPVIPYHATLDFEIGRGILSRISSPSGYDKSPKRVTCEIFIHFFGTALR